MRYPYENYIKALACKGHDELSISERLRTLKLIPPTELEIARISNSVLDTVPQDVRELIEHGARYDLDEFITKASQQLMAAELDDIIPVLREKRIPQWEEALLIMTDPELRMYVMCLTICQTLEEDILEGIKKRFREDVSELGLFMFKKYFWDIADMSRLELYHFISSCSIQKHRQLLMNAFRHHEKELKWQLEGESLLTLEDILQNVMHESFYKFKNLVTSEEIDNVTRTQQWANLAIKAAEKLETMKTSGSDNIISLLEFNLSKVAQSDIPLADKSDDVV